MLRVSNIFHNLSNLNLIETLTFFFVRLPDFEAASSKAGKVEAEVKRLHTLIVDINSHKLKAQRDKLDRINKELDDCSSAITKAKVAIKTAAR